MDERVSGLTFDVKVKGMRKLQDMADIMRDIRETITIRDNETVNIYISNNYFGDNKEEQE